MRYIVADGGLWKVTDEEWINWLQRMASGEDPILPGKYLGQPETVEHIDKVMVAQYLGTDRLLTR